MPPLPPNITKAGLLRGLGGWNNSSLSRRDNRTRGLLSTRMPHSLGTTGGGIPNPPLGIGVIREAMPRHAAGTWQPGASPPGASSPCDNWTFKQTLRSLVGIPTITDFGDGIAIDGNTIVVGTGTANDYLVENPAEDQNAYVFTRSGGSWAYVRELRSLVTDTIANDFGFSVAVSGNTIVVGSDDASENANAYVFTKTGGSWGYTRALRALVPDPPIAYFGMEVAIDGNTVVVSNGRNVGPGDDNGVYVFTKSGGTWGYTDVWRVGGGVVDVSGNTISVGAPASTDGEVYLFSRSNGIWQPNLVALRGILVGAGVTVADDFGAAVALCGDVVAVGTDWQSDSATPQTVYVFEKVRSTWQYVADLGLLLEAAGVTGGASSSEGIACSGNTIVLGDANDSRAHVFTRQSGGWRYSGELAELVPGGVNEEFGDNVAVSGKTIIVGADDFGGDDGEVYVFECL